MLAWRNLYRIRRNDISIEVHGHAAIDDDPGNERGQLGPHRARL
jgi:hypothetical protein